MSNPRMIMRGIEDSVPDPEIRSFLKELFLEEISNDVEEKAAYKARFLSLVANHSKGWNPQ